MATNFLAVPSKQAVPIPDLAPQLLNYISRHFRDAHPEAFKKDVDSLVAMRRQWVEPKIEAHPEIAKGLTKYHAQLAFVATKFPSDIGVSFAYMLPFPPPYSITPDAPISLPSLTYERAAVLYNIASIYGTLAAMERRAEQEGIKRALDFLKHSAGVLNYLITAVLPTLKSEISNPQSLGYDMTESFLTTMREFVMAEAQECFWQHAVLSGGYKNTIIAKLSMKVSELYQDALTAANGMDFPSASYYSQAWINHMTVKSLHFEAAAQYRQSQDDLEKNKYGCEIARLKAAQELATKGLGVGKKGVTDSVLADLKNLSSAVKVALERAVRDNDLVYMYPIPPASELPKIEGVIMVKLVTPPEIAEPIASLMNGSAGTSPLFAALVPYGVHLALSVYDDRKDTLVREMDGKREELDGIAASTLQSLNLPGSLQALERPIGLPPSLLKKAEEVEAAGGAEKIRGLFMDVNRLAKSNAKLLSDSLDILDQEAHETEQLIERQPHLAETRPPSHVANQQLIGMAQQYDATLKQAAQSDTMVRGKWEEWRHLIEILSGGEDIISDHVPSTTSSSSGFASLPSAVRPLRASLEEIDDHIAHRAALVAEARQMSEHDDVRPEVLQEASRLAHGGSGDVKPEWFEPIFEKALAKYDRLRDSMAAEPAAQEKLLEQIRQQNERFLAERKEDPRVKERERSLQEMDVAFWKWREIADNAEEGIKFYNSFAAMLSKLKEECSQFLNARRVDVGQVTSHLQNVSLSESSTPSQSSPPPPPQSPPVQPYSPPTSLSGRFPGPGSPMASPPPAVSPPAATPASPPARSPPAFLPPPSSMQWQSVADFLPPPPPAPVIRSGGIPMPVAATPLSPRAPPAAPSTPARNSAPAEDTPRRITRSAARQPPMGDPQNNPYKKGSRRGGEGVI